LKSKKPVKIVFIIPSLQSGGDGKGNVPAIVLFFKT